MSTAGDGEIYDCIVVGSRTAGAVVARGLGGRGQKFLILERGPYLTLKETLSTFKPKSN